MMKQLLADIKNDVTNKNLRLIVISSNGPVFCAGHDLKELVSWVLSCMYDILSLIVTFTQKDKNINKFLMIIKLIYNLLLSKASLMSPLLIIKG